MSIDTRPLWALVADWLPVYSETEGLEGLCKLISKLEKARVIRYEEGYVMQLDITRAVQSSSRDVYDGYLFAKGVVKPRVEWCRKMARRGDER